MPFASHTTSRHARPRSAASPSPSPTTGPSAIVVYVAGAVVTPGVYTLGAGGARQRCGDRRRRCGADADLDVVNLAAVVHDGERIYVPTVGEAVPAGDRGDPRARRHRSRRAGQRQLGDGRATRVLPGVGPATAAAIVAHREQHGPFQCVDELGDVRGIGPAKLEALRGLVTV